MGETKMNDYHIPVLLHEVLEALRVKKGGMYIDATLGGGGHTSAILEKGGRVLGIDQDEDALSYVSHKYEGNTNLTLAYGNFRDIEEYATRAGFTNVDGILFDLGISSHQVDTPERGFSFFKDAPLDMRMDKGMAVTASDLVNGMYKDELLNIFVKYGEEEQAKRIVNAIVEARREKKIETTQELARIIESVKKRVGRIHPATKVFQALRIAVNDELGSLEKALDSAPNLMKPGGRIAIISFHSLEDRIVKHFFMDHASEFKAVNDLITPSFEEIEENPRSRSSKLRVYEKRQ